MDDILEAYAAAAPALIAPFEALDPATVYAPVLDLLPRSPVRVADIGAGTGRDAAWFAREGHAVLAVEPVAALREAGRALHRAEAIEWLDDRLPELAEARSRGPFGLVTLCGVWQHIDDAARRRAMANLGRMMRPGGMLILSLRHGPGAPGRRVFQASPDETIAWAGGVGLTLLRRVEVDSIQPGNRALGVRWTWLALGKPA